MASAILANRTEPSWTQPRETVGGGKKMGKSAKNAVSNFAGQAQFQALETFGYEVNDESTPHATQSASASSINRRLADVSQSQYVSFDLTSRSRKELSDLKIRLVSELDQIRRLRDRINSGKLSARSSHDAPNKKPSNKKISGNKRPPAASNSSKDVKRSHNSEIGESGNSMKSCALVLSKLMKHKHGWIFNSPVDVMGMGLHDYYDVVKRPMDLGTVKANVGKNMYATPLEFAEDVKLTFTNAMLYNPKDHDVYHMAEQLLVRFEELFRPIYEKFEDEQRQERLYDEELPANSWTNVEPERTNQEVTLPVGKKSLPANSWTDVEPEKVKKKQKVGKKSEQARGPPKPSQSPVRAVQVKTLKQPKPKAKDPNKREMSLEEKHKLGVGLQSLPQEKMEQVVQIISKRNGHLRHDGDEIELDIEAVDTETLWELDRFVTNWKKLVSKIKRQALMNNNGGSGSGSIGHNEEVPQNERIGGVMKTKMAAEGEGGDEDVDIDDDLPTSSYAPVEIEKDGGGGGGGGGAKAGGRASSSSNSSSSSGSDSSSSSDSDSGSSSGSDSEADNAHS